MGLNGFDALSMWFFRHDDIEVYCKSVMETVLSHLHVRGRGHSDQFTSSAFSKIPYILQKKNPHGNPPIHIGVLSL